MLPTSAAFDSLKANNALKVIRFGDLSLLNGEWMIIGNIPEWSREDWPIPDFVRRDEIIKRAWRIKYSDDNLLEPIIEEPVSYDVYLERDGGFGAGAVELLLTKLLSD